MGADVGQGVGVAVGAGVGCSMNWAWVPVRKGAVTIARAMAAAASAPCAVRTRWRQRSIPAAVPAEVQTPVSSTKRASGSTWIAGWRAARVRARCQWVTARRPSRRPARASTKAPAQREATGVPAVWARRSASRTGAGRSASGSSMPGTRTRSVGVRSSSQVSGRSGVRVRPPRTGMGVCGSVAVLRSSKGGTPRRVRSLPQTSVMTEMSKARMPGKERSAMRWGRCAGAAARVTWVAVNHRSLSFDPLGEGRGRRQDRGHGDRRERSAGCHRRAEGLRGGVLGEAEQPGRRGEHRGSDRPVAGDGAAGRLRAARLGGGLAVAAADGVRGERLQGLRRGAAREGQRS